MDINKPCYKYAQVSVGVGKLQYLIYLRLRTSLADSFVSRRMWFEYNIVFSHDILPFALSCMT